MRVECYAGYRGQETPRRFTLGPTTFVVAEVMDRWRAPDHRYFKVRADDGGTYVLRHDVAGDSWELYDLKTDRAEQQNLAAKMPERVKELSAIWQKQTDAFVASVKTPAKDK